MQPIAHAPEQLLRARDLLRLAPDQDPDLYELAPDVVRDRTRVFADAVTRPRDPSNAVEVAQRSGAVLHVRLEQVHRAAEAIAPRRRLRVDAIDERAEVVLSEDPLVRLVDERSQQVCVAGEQSQIEQRRGRLEVLLREGDDLADAQHLMAHGQTGVPQRVEQGLGEGRGVLRPDGVRVDDEDHVGVAPERDGSPAKAADGRQGDAARKSRMAFRALEQQTEARVQKARVRPTQRDTVLAGLEPRDEALAMSFERVAQRERLERRRGDARRRSRGHGHFRTRSIRASL